ncbi:MAG: type II toxin-antitoxin system VapC family toxin [Deltaproteobacteria bacterium]|nr:type II toxin-antitoxin system VapC family toxin [Deltaproteobacteria bacterium]
MKWVVDSCGWIEYFTKGTLVASFRPYLRDISQCIVPTLVQYELYKWVYRNHGELKADEILATSKQGYVSELDTELALSAAIISSENRLAMADAIVYATAVKHKVSLITSDAHFASLPGVTYLKK